MIDARYKVIPVLAANEAAASTGAVNSTAVNMQGDVGVAFHLDVTEATGLTNVTMVLETSPDNSTWTTATSDETVGEEDGDLSVVLDDVGTAQLSYSGIVQYVRAVVAVAATDVDFNVISTQIAQFTKTPIAIPGNA